MYRAALWSLRVVAVAASLVIVGCGQQEGAAGCRADKDCASGSACVVGACVPKIMGETQTWALEMVPKIVFAPIFVTWFGFGFLPKILIVFLVCFFPILLNGILAFTSLSEDLGRFCRSTGAGPLTTFFRVRLPAALPQLFVGIKSAAVNATVGACVSEWVGGDAGLGYYIQIASGDMRMDIGFAAIFVLAALGLLLFGLVVLAERWLIPWHVSQRVSAHIHGG